MPLELCTPATIDLVVMLFINLNGNWGHHLGCIPLPHKKKLFLFFVRLRDHEHFIALLPSPAPLPKDS